MLPGTRSRCPIAQRLDPSIYIILAINEGRESFETQTLFILAEYRFFGFHQPKDHCG